MAKIIIQPDMTPFNDNIENSGTLTAENGAAVLVQPGVALNGSIINRGEIVSANSANGIGISFENGSELNGEILNTGLINGGRDGINFANGGQVSGKVLNKGTITSTSRGINIGGNQITVVNQGLITTTANPRNGTVYSDVTANNYYLDNQGTIDVGAGNNGDAISWELDAGINTSIVNSGLAQGRGVAVGTNLSSAVRLFPGKDAKSEIASFNGNIENSGKLAAENGAAVVIQPNVQLNGSIINTGIIEGGAYNNGKLAIDVSSAVNFVKIDNQGTINGDVLFSNGNDIFNGSQGTTRGAIKGDAGDDILFGGNGNYSLNGGTGNDLLSTRGGNHLLTGK